jgi:hypothetical protein
MAHACTALALFSEDSSGNHSPVGGSTAVSLSGNGSGDFFSDATCLTPMAGFNFTSASAEMVVYFSDATTENLTFAASATGLSTGNFPLTMIAPPPDGGSFAAAATSTTAIHLSWTAGGGITVGYRLAFQRGGVAPPDCLSAPSIGNVTSYDATGLTVGALYSFRLCAFDAGSPVGISAGVTASVATLMPAPTDPSGLVLQVAGPTQIDLSWAAAGGWEIGYRVAWQAGSTPPANCLTGSNAANALSYNVTGLTGGTLYSFRLCSYNGNPSPDYSPGLTFSATPGGLTLVNLHTNQLVETGFLIGSAVAGVLHVGCQFDGSGPIETATGSTHWSCALPHGAQGWKTGSPHTVTAGILIGGVLSATQSIPVVRGNNRDVDGDGYPDLAVADGGAGLIYIYHGGSGGLSATSTVSAPSGVTGFGTALALDDFDGNGYADLAVGSAGRVDIFYGGSSGLQAAPGTTLTAPTGATDFGVSVGAGDTNGDGYPDLAVGSTEAASGAGKVYVFEGQNGGLSSSYATITGTIGGGALGAAIAVADVNGDGYADVVIGATAVRNGNGSTGAVYLYEGAPGGIATSQTQALTPTVATVTGFGASLAMGDINQDGAADLAVGTLSSGAGDGYVFVYLGGGVSGFVTPGTTLSGPAGALNGFGFSVAFGDINGDGFADLAVGANVYFSGGASSAVYVYDGSHSGIGTTPATLRSPEAENGFGTNVSIADFNSDGYDELAVGSPPPDATSIGAAAIYNGAHGGPPSQPTLTLSDPNGAGISETFGAPLR